MLTQKFSSCAVAASLAAALYFAGCVGGETAANSNPEAPPAAATPRRETTPATAEPAEGTTSPTAEAEASADVEQADDFAGTLGKTEKAGGGAPALLRAVRTSRRDKYDRVVFEFEGERVPGYRVEYVGRPAVRQCGSGEAVRVNGGARLRVSLTPANAHTEAGEATVTDRARRLSYPNLKELKILCDFEAEVEWVMGLTRRARYRVLELTGPARLVVDVKKR
jgi:hypothetical protein